MTSNCHGCSSKDRPTKRNIHVASINIQVLSVYLNPHTFRPTDRRVLLLQDPTPGDGRLLGALSASLFRGLLLGSIRGRSADHPSFLPPSGSPSKVPSGEPSGSRFRFPSGCPLGGRSSGASGRPSRVYQRSAAGVYALRGASRNLSRGQSRDLSYPKVYPGVHPTRIDQAQFNTFLRNCIRSCMLAHPMLLAVCLSPPLPGLQRNQTMVLAACLSTSTSAPALRGNQK